MGRALSVKAAMLEDARLSSAIKRSNAAGREQTTARILLHGPTVGRLRFDLAAQHPAYPVPNEQAENLGARKHRRPEEPPSLTH